MIGLTECLLEELTKTEEGRKLLEIFADDSLTKKQKPRAFQQWLKGKKSVCKQQKLTEKKNERKNEQS